MKLLDLTHQGKSNGLFIDKFDVKLIELFKFLSKINVKVQKTYDRINIYTE